MDELVHRENLSPNCDARALPVSMVVLHYTGMPSAAEAEARMCDATCKVSAHYMIGEDGEVVRLVPEHKRAWHAGRSYWRGITDVNSASIGIELVNPGHEWGYRAFPEAQMQALLPLLARIVRDYDLPRANVVGHSDVAPARKEDPGELFDWPGLAAEGVGLWPEAGEPAGDPLGLLGAIGYRTDLPLPVLLRAFQRHWRPERVDGAADAGTLARLAGVAAAVG
jgi:N-acetylmuramoyl-L-alanine amidase